MQVSSRLLAEDEGGIDDVQSLGAMGPEDLKEELFPASLPHYRQPAVRFFDTIYDAFFLVHPPKNLRSDHATVVQIDWRGKDGKAHRVVRVVVLHCTSEIGRIEGSYDVCTYALSNVTYVLY